MCALSSGLAPAIAKPGISPRTEHYVEFLARRTEFAVDHAFVRIGRTGSNGRDRASITVAFFPAGYPNINLTTPLFNTTGSIRSVPEDRPSNATARYRVWIDASTYRKAIAHGKWMSRHWRHYDLFARNCNSVLFEYADRLGLDVPKLHVVPSSSLVHAMMDANPQRVRRDWKKQAPA